MTNWRRDWPEYEPWKNGDPFVAELVKADDIVHDHRYNRAWLGLDDDVADQTIAWVERERLTYELETLFRWWAL